MEDITNTDYMHAKRVCKDFKIKKIGDYHDLYLVSENNYFWLTFLKTLEKCVSKLKASSFKKIKKLKKEL